MMLKFHMIQCENKIFIQTYFSGYKSDVEKDMLQIDALKKEIEDYSINFGLKNDKTLRKIFRLLELYINHYKLIAMDELLQRISETCKELRNESTWYIKYIQMLGFCRYKQYRFREALKLFLEQESIVGGESDILCENIGHTYSSLGEYENAIRYFNKGILICGDNITPYRKAGFLYGLSLATDRLGDTSKALPLLHKALDGYSQGSNYDETTIAKVKSSISHMHEKLRNIDESIRYSMESLKHFRKTVGNESPLTITAAGDLGKLWFKKHEYEHATPLLHEALIGESKKDAFQIDDTFNIIHTLKQLHMKHKVNGKEPTLHDLRSRFSPYLSHLQVSLSRAEKVVGTSNKHGDVAALFKVVGEVLILSGDYRASIPAFSKAIDYLKYVKNVDTSELTLQCQQLLAIAQNNIT